MGVRVLVIEDDGLSRLVLQDMLALIRGDLEIVAVADGLAALQALERARFDLVLSDVDLPGMGGTELVRRIKQAHADLPVVCVTAFAVSGDREKLLLEGFDDYLSKPVVLEELERLLKRYLPPALAADH